MTRVFCRHCIYHYSDWNSLCMHSQDREVEYNPIWGRAGYEHRADENLEYNANFDCQYFSPRWYVRLAEWWKSIWWR